MIDLSTVSEEVCNECENVDLIILEGMGRSIETNLGALFACDSLKIGMVKHNEVADCLGGMLCYEYPIIKACSQKNRQQQGFL